MKVAVRKILTQEEFFTGFTHNKVARVLRFAIKIKPAPSDFK